MGEKNGDGWRIFMTLKLGREENGLLELLPASNGGEGELESERRGGEDERNAEKGAKSRFIKLLH